MTEQKPALDSAGRSGQVEYDRPSIHLLPFGGRLGVLMTAARSA